MWYYLGGVVNKIAIGFCQYNIDQNDKIAHSCLKGNLFKVLLQSKTTCKNDEIIEISQIKSSLIFLESWNFVISSETQNIH